MALANEPKPMVPAVRLPSGRDKGIINMGDSMKFILDMVHHNPSEQETETKYMEPKYLKSLGYNGQVLKNINLTAAYEKSSPGTVAKDRGLQDWIEDVRLDFDMKFKKIRKAGIGVFSHIDLFLFPSAIVEKITEKIFVNDSISIYREKTREFLEDMFDEVLERYPDLDGFIIRTGETYLFDSPYHTGNNPVPYFTNSEHNFEDGYISVNYNKREKALRREKETFIYLINFLKKIICGKHKKILIFRTWDVFEDRFHADREYYLSITDRIDVHDSLYFSIKHTTLDFFRNVEPNPCIGVGKHQQIIEVQFQREYEGKGAYPNYFTHHLIDGFPETKQKKGFRDYLNSDLIRGVFCWSRGGGWYGPYINNEFWIDLNLEVFMRWIKNPALSEDKIFYAYLKELGFNQESQKLIRKISCSSSEAVLKGRYCSVGEINKVWMRDDVIGGLVQLGKSFKEFKKKNQVDAVLREKHESVLIWKKIVSLSKSIDHKNEDLRQFIEASCEYGLRLFKAIEKAWRVLLRHQDSSSSLDTDIAAFFKAWEDYHNLKSEYPQYSTLFRGKYWNWPGEELSPGMIDSIQARENELW